MENLPTTEVQDQIGFTGKFYQTFREALTLLRKLFLSNC